MNDFLILSFFSRFSLNKYDFPYRDLNSVLLNMSLIYRGKRSGENEYAPRSSNYNNNRQQTQTKKPAPKYGGYVPPLDPVIRKPKVNIAGRKSTHFRPTDLYDVFLRESNDLVARIKATLPADIDEDEKNSLISVRDAHINQVRRRFDGVFTYYAYSAKFRPGENSVFCYDNLVAVDLDLVLGYTPCNTELYELKNMYEAMESAFKAADGRSAKVRVVGLALAFEVVRGWNTKKVRDLHQKFLFALNEWSSLSNAMLAYIVELARPENYELRDHCNRVLVPKHARLVYAWNELIEELAKVAGLDVGVKPVPGSGDTKRIARRDVFDAQLVKNDINHKDIVVSLIEQQKRDFRSILDGKHPDTGRLSPRVEGGFEKLISDLNRNLLAVRAA
jgi:hypothetical protein